MNELVQVARPHAQPRPFYGGPTRVLLWLRCVTPPRPSPAARSGARGLNLALVPHANRPFRPHDHVLVVGCRHLRDELEIEVAQQDGPDGRYLGGGGQVKMRLGADGRGGVRGQAAGGRVVNVS